MRYVGTFSGLSSDPITRKNLPQSSLALNKKMKMSQDLMSNSKLVTKFDQFGQTMKEGLLTTTSARELFDANSFVR